MDIGVGSEMISGLVIFDIPPHWPHMAYNYDGRIIY